MSPFVADASALANFWFDDEALPETRSLFTRLVNTYVEAPMLLPFEFLNTLRMAERKKRIAPQAAALIWEEFQMFGVRLDLEAPSAAWIWTIDLCRKYDLTVYDAAYLELALRRGLPLATLDKDLRKAAVAAGIGLVL